MRECVCVSAGLQNVPALGEFVLVLHGVFLCASPQEFFVDSWSPGTDKEG